VQATKDGETLTKVASGGSCVFDLPEYGTWSVTATLSGQSASDEVTADAVKQYQLTLNYISDTLEDNDWDVISKAFADGVASSYWSNGDTKNIVINGQVGNTNISNLTVSTFIIGINHNAAREGNNRGHFQIGKINGKLIGLVDANYGSNVSTTGYFSMNSSNTNSGGWKSSQMRANIMGGNGTPTAPTTNSLMAALPADLRAVMVPVTKYTDNTGGGSDNAGYVTATTEYLCLLDEFEYHGARTYGNSAAQNYQKQYDYYKAGNSKVHYKHNDTSATAYAWCRGPRADYSGGFCLVDTNGTAYAGSAYISYAVAPGFFVGSAA
jgi:hypothetical protein